MPLLKGVIATTNPRPDTSDFVPSAPAAKPLHLSDRGWFAEHSERQQLLSLGFRLKTGGTHLSRTIMLAELRHVLDTEAQPTSERPRSLILGDNVLQKRTGSARCLSLRHLRELYGLGAPRPIQRAMIALWPKAGEGQSLFALLGALPREALLRESAEVVFAAPPGSRLLAGDIAGFLEERYSGHYSLKMIGKISRNCASCWTQSGHLEGRVRKARGKP